MRERRDKAEERGKDAGECSCRKRFARLLKHAPITSRLQFKNLRLPAEKDNFSMANRFFFLFLSVCKFFFYFIRMLYKQYDQIHKS